MTSTGECPRTVCACPRPESGACPAAQPRNGLLDADFAAFHDRHRVNFLKYAELRGLSGHDAEDVVSEAFLALYRAREALRASDKPEAFAFKVLHDELVDHWRALDRHPQLVGAPGAEEPAPDEVAVLIARLDLQRVLDRLPTQQAKCLALRVFLGHGTEEIARYLGITTSAVRSHLCSARKRIKAELGIDIGQEGTP
jgi:RNA polymerase sigma-70 factor (ECF subfamily)